MGHNPFGSLGNLRLNRQGNPDLRGESGPLVLYPLQLTDVLVAVFFQFNGESSTLERLQIAGHRRQESKGG